ncbi:hypothetical protein [Lysinibacillus sphaericus]|uniref:Uncharacterized protein n=1 Tax=Lysinibacillus sphaericus OT4b.31 TaxID=1285586 RepID=R7ZFD7_LYSSH|nr:hypothetical protein [Lysinibacillus sphaericus]EON72845.1 hypothetical protein H131_09058 [Lysinibacillus sphaericus OT4b.31]
MKLQLPHRMVELKLDLPIEERVQYISFMLENEKIVYQGEEITLELYFSITSHAYNTIILLDMIGYYITKGYFTKAELLLEEENLKFIKETKKRNNRRREITKLLRNQSAQHQLQDNYVLSHHKQKEIKKGSIRHNTFSNTSYLEAITFGIEEVEEDHG